MPDRRRCRLKYCSKPKQNLSILQGAGMSIMEMSHRGAIYEQVHNEAQSLLRELFGIPDNYKVLFLQGGASTQFAMIPMNLLPARQGWRLCA